METQRGFSDYLHQLVFAHGSIHSSLEAVWRNKGRWLDMGCGEARALQEYLGLLDENLPIGFKGVGFTLPGPGFHQVEIVGITAHPQMITLLNASTGHRTSDDFATALQNSIHRAAEERKKYTKGRLIVYEGRMIEEMSPEQLGSFDLITDIKGAAFYSPKPDVVINRGIAMLKPWGRFIFLIPEARKVITKTGKVISMGEWLWNILGKDSTLHRAPVAEDGVYTFTILRDDNESLPTIPALSLEEVPPHGTTSDAIFREK